MSNYRYNNSYSNREYAFIAEALGRVSRRLNRSSLDVVVRDEVASAFDEYLTRKVSDLVTRYPSGAVFVDAVFTTKCIDAVRHWRAQRGEGVKGERLVQLFDEALADSMPAQRALDPLDRAVHLHQALIARVGRRKADLVVRVTMLGEDTATVAADYGISRSRASHLINEALDELRRGDDWRWLE
ncbi:MAG: hypothetical protein ACKOCE_05975 [Acidimicrobiia bacterium]